MDVHAEEIDENQAVEALKATGVSSEMIELLIDRQRLELSKVSAVNEWDAQIISRKIFDLNGELSHLATETGIPDGVRFNLHILRLNPTE